jgi:hypothetical protein
MSPEIKYAVIFENDMLHPLLIIVPNLTEFAQQLIAGMMKYGKIEIMYRVY